MKIKFFLKIIVTFSLFVFYTFSAFKEHKTALVKREQEKVKLFNTYSHQRFDYLFSIQEGVNEIDKDELVKYQRYYQMTVKLFGQPEAWGMLGYCEFYLGNIKDSISCFKKAIKSDPDFFWYHYNLGLIYYKLGQYEKSAGSFKKAVNINAGHTFKVISSSKIFLQVIIARKSRTEVSFSDRLKEGYKNALVFLSLSDKRIKNEKYLALTPQIF